jgi:polyisoprenoid-binding protein YceI
LPNKPINKKSKKMKKVIYSMMAFAAIAFTSCGTAETTENTEATVPVIEGTYVMDQGATLVWKAKHNNDEDYVYNGTVSASGEVNVANGVINGGVITFDMASLDKEGDDEWSVKLEGHLKSADFFNLEMFPTFTYTVGASNETTIKGELSFLGAKHALDMPATITFEGDKMMVSGMSEVNFAELGTPYWAQFDTLPEEEKAAFATPTAGIEFNFTFTKTAAVQ